ncbi:MAG TPA: glycosyltransferase family 39 protein [Hymenobacter sp.]|uniref:ArnT family glycosyltransferase n=1 Tax=Hymenobacter sp. TaxID=1898978 RepID=UPI002D7FF1EF|nr:glycosyltransferase family 39 protein [Hymenobacter sp.]HET9506205.1 glycosyltransferase family 39 protein [Hymenobacter sp.]
MLARIAAKKPTAYYAILLPLVLALGVWVRVAHFPHIPPGFNQDEAASAYEAFALAETGLDRWGDAWPAYFTSWGSGQSVLLAYLTVPIVKVFGLSIGSARVAMLVLSVLSLPLLAYCLRPLGRYPALLGTLLLAVAPWHFMLSRWGLDCNLAPCFMLLGCTTLSRALLTQRRRWIISSLLPFALALYSYGTTVLVLPAFFVLVLLLLGLRPWRARLGSWLLAGALFVVVGTPFFLFFIENYVLGHNLAWTDSLFFSTPMLLVTRSSQVSSASWSQTFFNNWNFLLASFNDGSSYNLLQGFRLLLSQTLPFAVVALLIGGWQLARRRGRPALSPGFIVLALFVAWGLASFVLFFSFDLNVNRFNHFFLPCIVLAAWGAARTIDSFGPTVPRQVVRAVAVLWLLLEGGWAMDTYVYGYANGPIKNDFNAGLDEAFGAVEHLWGVDQVRITNNMPLPYLYTLFYLRYPPADFQREMKARNTDNVYDVRRFGRYVFANEELTPGHAYGYLSRRNEYPDNEQQHRAVIFTNESWEVGIMQPTAAGK